MLSEFVQHFTRSLTLLKTRPISFGPRLVISQHEEGNSNTLRSLLIKCQSALNYKDVYECVLLLHLHQGAFVASEANRDGSALEEAIVGQLTVALYANVLNEYLAQATQAEAEAEWWADMEDSTVALLIHLLQTLPLRISRVVTNTLDTLRARQLPVSVSSFRSLLAPPSFIFRPSLIMTSLFPHLQDHQNLSLAILFPPDDLLVPSSSTTVGLAHRHFLYAFTFISRLINLPIELTRQECRHSRRALEKIRDERAKVIGELAQLRTPLGELTSRSHSVLRINGPRLPNYTSFLNTLCRVVDIGPPSPSSSSTSSSHLDSLDDVCQTLSSLDSVHANLLQERRLLRPSRFTRLWPSLLILPPLSLYAYANHTSCISALAQMAKDAKETIRGFIQGWLVEPLVGVLRTVRAGSGGDFLVHEEGVAADLESLERMTLSLARDRLQFTPQQLETLAEKIRLGDLTPVMQIYEEDIRHPFRSALTGTLLRNLFIQVQKAKVDIDQALSGIDKLLKSQELTFALMGVAPAFAIVYVLGGAVLRMWNGSIVKGRWGGRKKRRGVWEGLRRIERLLTKQPPKGPSKSPTTLSTAPLAPLPTGLLILSLTRLRSYALNHLPANIREPFLEDLGDLEDTQLGTEAKLRIVDRMWRCWGGTGQGVIRF